MEGYITWLANTNHKQSFRIIPLRDCLSSIFVNGEPKGLKTSILASMYAIVTSYWELVSYSLIYEDRISGRGCSPFNLILASYFKSEDGQAPKRAARLGKRVTDDQ